MVDEDWLLNKGYRDKIYQKLKIVNRDITDTVRYHSYGSSFIGPKLAKKQDLISRINQIEIPKYMKEMLNYNKTIKARKHLGFL